MNVQMYLTRFIKMLFIKVEGNLATLFWNLILFGFLVLPFGALSTPFILLSMAIGIIHFFYKKQSKSIRINWFFLSFPALFLTMFISLYYSYDLHTGKNLLVRSLPIFFFPLLISSQHFQWRIMFKILNGLLIGTLLSFCCNLAFALYRSIQITKGQFFFDSSIKGQLTLKESIIDGGNYFIGGEFSSFIHPSYISLYVLIAIIYLAFKVHSLKIKVISIAFLIIYLFLLSSKAALLMLPMIGVLSFIGKVKSLNFKIKLLLMVMVPTVIFLLIVLNPRVIVGYNRLKNLESESNFKYTTSSVSRILSWKASIDLIKKAPLLGYGVGDANEELLIYYLNNDYFTNADNRYNAHNQYLQTLLQVGFIGFTFLVIPFVGVFKRRVGFFDLSIILVLLISLFFESMLIRYHGIVFYAIMIPLLLKYTNPKPKGSIQN
ncbi:O-antigen ligase family protein [Flagellimonas oceanensis]|uniref:O-antigen ligase family protein n=1 Tax=Flagellimonas oceanensis TaxID=2499163 RepID=UPI003BACBD43